MRGRSWRYDNKASAVCSLLPSTRAVKHYYPGVLSSEYSPPGTEASGWLACLAAGPSPATTSTWPEFNPPWVEIAWEASERETSASQLPARFQAPPDANKSHNFPNDPRSCTPRTYPTNREHFLFTFNPKVAFGNKAFQYGNKQDGYRVSNPGMPSVFTGSHLSGVTGRASRSVEEKSLLGQLARRAGPEDGCTVLSSRHSDGPYCTARQKKRQPSLWATDRPCLD
ncbi:hypothetical protein NQZ68_012173 [Dissostichus eleginoides]|nr:hypothetical protein NQZ68_012173 [Dissostichus eleginoides]